MADYETERQANIQRNQALIKSLGLANTGPNSAPLKRPPAKKRKIAVSESRPTRSSARIASAPKASYRSPSPPSNAPRSRNKVKKASQVKREVSPDLQPTEPSPPPASLSTLIESWSSWSPEAPEPDRDADGTFRFASYPSFTPNKSPLEILREGAFGGTYFRPLYSSKLRMRIQDDYLNTLPPEWLEGLNVEKYLTSEDYDPEVNKYGVACGQSIEEWEKAGWIRHEFDARGWFEWYCRFFRGRRCEDDERQVGRWERCVGEKGRWRRVLTKKYIQAGIRSVMDDGDEDEEVQGGRRLSPVVHQTCFHWAWEIRQETLDRLWGDID
ncbi:hypothetical protein MMC10_001195 [Thelotrema lepadinum]|nr:hypothetical protein [Thelotrema lepadinum]